MNENNCKANVKIKKEEKKDGKELIKIKLELPEKIGWYEDIMMIIEKDGKEEVLPLVYSKSSNGQATFECNVELSTSAIYHYYFICKINGRINYIKKNAINNNVISKEDMFKLSVGFSVPDWAKGAVMYHIFVDRFKRGEQEKQELSNRHLHTSWDEEMQIGPDENGIWNNDFYGGDLKGITEKLDYIKSLGVTILYLSPIVRSQSNHRYDTADYLEVDPYAGTSQDLKELCDEAHKRGMKVILDAVFNHTGNDSKYFNEYGNYETIGAYQSPSSPYYNFYKKHYEDQEAKFDYWWGMTNLPVCDGNSKEWKEFITGENGVIDTWFSLGIDGLRLDVADELSDEFIELIRKAVKRNKEDGFIIGEVWKNPMRMQKDYQNRSYISSGKGMDTVMDYPLVDSLLRYYKYADRNALERILKEILTEYPEDTINSLMNFTSTHDISRLITILGIYLFDQYGEWAWNLKNNDIAFCKNFRLSKEEYNRAKEILKSYIFTLDFLPGTLSIFYGDEVGIDGLGNLANRRPFPWDNMDEELLEYYRYIGKIRSNEAVLKDGSLNIIDINPSTFLFERENDNSKMLVLASRSSEEQRILIPKEYEQNTSEIYTTSKRLVKTLPPYGAIAIKKDK